MNPQESEINSGNRSERDIIVTSSNPGLKWFRRNGFFRSVVWKKGTTSPCQVFDWAERNFFLWFSLGQNWSEGVFFGRIGRSALLFKWDVTCRLGCSLIDRIHYPMVALRRRDGRIDRRIRPDRPAWPPTSTGFVRNRPEFLLNVTQFESFFILFIFGIEWCCRLFSERIETWNLFGPTEYLISLKKKLS